MKCNKVSFPRNINSSKAIAKHNIIPQINVNFDKEKTENAEKSNDKVVELSKETSNKVIESNNINLQKDKQKLNNNLKNNKNYSNIYAKKSENNSNTNSNNNIDKLLINLSTKKANNSNKALVSEVKSKNSDTNINASSKKSNQITQVLTKEITRNKNTSSIQVNQDHSQQISTDSSCMNKNNCRVNKKYSGNKLRGSEDVKTIELTIQTTGSTRNTNKTKLITQNSLKSNSIEVFINSINSLNSINKSNVKSRHIKTYSLAEENMSKDAKINKNDQLNKLNKFNQIVPQSVKNKRFNSNSSNNSFNFNTDQENLFFGKDLKDKNKISINNKDNSPDYKLKDKEINTCDFKNINVLSPKESKTNIIINNGYNKQNYTKIKFLKNNRSNSSNTKSLLNHLNKDNNEKKIDKIETKLTTINNEKNEASLLKKIKPVNSSAIQATKTVRKLQTCSSERNVKHSLISSQFKNKDYNDNKDKKETEIKHTTNYGNNSPNIRQGYSDNCLVGSLDIKRKDSTNKSNGITSLRDARRQKQERSASNSLDKDDNRFNKVYENLNKITSQNTSLDCIDCKTSQNIQTNQTFQNIQTTMHNIGDKKETIEEVIVNNNTNNNSNYVTNNNSILPTNTNIIKINVQRFSMNDFDNNKFINLVRMKKKLSKMKEEENVNLGSPTSPTEFSK